MARIHLVVLFCIAFPSDVVQADPGDAPPNVVFVLAADLELSAADNDRVAAE